MRSLNLRFSSSGEEDFLRVFTLYRHGGYLGHVTWIIYIHLAMKNLASEREIFEYFVLYKYIAQGWGQTNPWSQNVFRIINIQGHNL